MRRPNATSRYRNSSVLVDGTEVYLGPRQVPATHFSAQDRYYRVVSGDDLTRVAAKVLGDPRYWWVVADFNDILDPFAELEEGAELRLPSQRRLMMEGLR